MRLFFLQNHRQHSHTLQCSLIYFAVEQYSVWNYLSQRGGGDYIILQGSVAGNILTFIDLAVAICTDEHHYMTGILKQLIRDRKHPMLFRDTITI